MALARSRRVGVVMVCGRFGSGGRPAARHSLAGPALSHRAARGPKRRSPPGGGPFVGTALARGGQSALRLRPDRIVLGELRGAESVSFLRAINTGHPGSFSTIHANSLRGALEQLALMVMQTGIGLTRADTIAYAASVIDVIVQLERSEGKRGISAIAWSGELV